jgi:hypothetical protein
MQPEQPDQALLRKRLDDISEGFREAIDREVETLRREGFPIYVSDDGQVIDLQQAERGA